MNAPAGSAAGLPLSTAQSEVWLAQQMAPTEILFNVGGYVEIFGAVDPEVFTAALRKALEEAGSPLSRFCETRAGVRQLPGDARDVTILSLDLTGEADPQAAALAWMEADYRKPFIFSEGPLCRFALLHLGGDRVLWYSAYHHLVTDFFGAQMLNQRAADLYDAASSGRAEPLATLTPWPEALREELEYDDSDRFQRDRLYWSERLRNLPDPATLSGRLPEWPKSTVSVRACLRGATIRGLEELGGSSGASLAAVLFSAAALYLWRVTGERDLVLGMPVDARTSIRLRRSTAFLSNIVPLRLTVDPSGSASQLVRYCGLCIREALSHQRYRSSTLRSDLGIAPNKPNLYGLMVNFLPDGAPCRFSGRPSRLHAFAQSAGVQDLNITVRARGDGSDAAVQFDANASNYDHGGLEAHARNFLTLLETLLDRPAMPIWRLPVMSDRKRQQILATWSGTDLPPDPRRVIELFQAEAQRAPQAHAVIRGEHCMTYGELDARASHLARRLIDAGIGRGRVVAVWADRSIEMVIGVLAAWKAGAAYLPLDPAHPVERVRMMLSEVRPLRLLSSKAAAAGARESCGIGCVAEEIDLTEPVADGAASAASGGSLDDIAYVIYTSGSSGAPKGVLVSQAGLGALAAAHAAHLQVDADSRVLQLASLTFDVSVAEMLMALTRGAALVLAPAEALGGEELQRLLITQRVTHALMTPTVLATLRYTRELMLQCLVVGGEACPTALIDEWSAGPRMINAYGPTESTVSATLSEPLRSGEPAPIGRPIAGTRVYVLDAGLEPVPCGVAGELYIGGVGLAAGYLNRPALTAERFIADPYGPPGSRIYRTGDRVRWREDGSLEYLSRADDQVKIRGQRIEPREIEARLARHAQVREAAVIAREDVPGEKRLVAYVTAPKEGAGASAEELRAYLQGVLPNYMVPSVFVVLDEMPLTASGKLDRRSLPAPSPSSHVSQDHEAPRGEVEEALAGIWQELLKVQRVGRNDNFFELGGHSLLIVQMMERLRRVGLSQEVRQVFESPTLADLAAEVARGKAAEIEVPPNLIPPGCPRITPEMLPLVELEPEHIERIVQAVPGGAANVQDIYPLVPLQEGILFHHLLDGQRGDTYVLPMLLTLASRAKLDEWIGALQKVIDRHDILRTAMLWEQLPRPVQVVHRRASLPVKEVKLTADRDPLEQLKERMVPELQKLDLRQAPLMRLQIAPAADGVQWYALLQLHHLLCDHESLELLLAEVISQLQGESSDLPPPLPYRVHVAQSLAYARRRDDEAFFRSKLADVDAPTAPFGMLEVLGHGSRVKEVSETLDSVLALRLRASARKLGVSAATLFHAAWGLVLARISGRDDVVFGDVLMTRLQGSAGAQRIMGMFINTLPLRLRLRGVSATELVKQTQREIIELLGHEQASLAVAQRCSGVTQPTPLFSGLLNYRHSSLDWSRSPLLPQVYIVTRGWTNYPLMLSVDERQEEFVLELSVDLRIDPLRMLDYVRTALRSLVEALEGASQAPALALPVLAAEEWRQVVEQFNATVCDYRQEKLIHELFEEQARRMPDAVAVEHEGRELTYSQLNRRANQLARYLSSQGVGPDQIVGICLARGLDMIIGLLGILKAGGAYLPLDPSHPAERLEQMLQEAAPQVVLTEADLTRVLPVSEAKVIALDAQHREIAGFPGEDIAVAELGSTSESLVYVIHTSGSTGKPKGTAMRHRSVVNLIEWHRRSFAAGEGCRVLQFAALSFDVAFQEIFSTLCTGGTLVLLDEWARRDPKALTELLSSRSIRRLFVPPLMLQSIAEYGRNADRVPGSLQEVIAAGEQLRISPEVRSFFGRLNGCRLHNHYGPTETHVVTALTLEGDPQQWPDLPSIGRPIANARVYVLDRQLQPMPIGVSGELYIGGASVARGYLNRPDLTEQRFIGDPYGSDPRGRLYRTGDLGRWRPDGTLEYLGRNDDQVKLRGFRIEPGEIESQLARHGRIKEAAVIAREDVSGEKRLVAYVTSREEGICPSAEELRAYLKRALPEYMVPSAFVALDALPLTPSGKLDRRALPVPAEQPQAHYEGPRTSTEVRLAAIWSEVLRAPLIGRSDDFFALGGHSLLALQVVARIRDWFHVELPLKELFDQPTLQSLATCIDRTLAGGGARSIAPVVPREWSGPAPLSYSQERMWLIQSLNPANTAYNMGTALWLSGELDVAAACGSFDELIARHEILRTRVQLIDEQPCQVVEPSRPGMLRFTDLRLHPDAASEALRRANADLRGAFDLGSDPVFRAQLLQTGETTFLFSFVLHHIAGDQWSLGLFGRELSALYNRRRRGETARLEPLPISYRDFAQWDRSIDRAAQIDGQLQFWRRELADLPTVDLPVDRPRPRLWTMNGSHHQRKVPQELLAALGRLARDSGSTVFMTLLAAYAALLERVSGQSDLPIGVPVANRTLSAVEGLIGVFVNTVVIRADVRGDPTFRELLARVRRTALDAFANQDVSFDRLVREVAQRSDRSHAPLAQVLFNVTNAPMHGIELEGVSWEPAVLDRGGAQFELSFTIDTELTHSLTVEYNTDLFERDTIERLADQYLALLESAASAPETRLSRLAILPATQRAALQRWNDTTAAVPTATFPASFAAQAARSADRIAISFDGSAMTYHELDSRSSSLASLLRRVGARRGERVAVCVGRSSQMLVSLLAVQKSGAAYVPLDPDFPAARLEHMLRDSGARVVLTSGPLPAGLKPREGVAIIDLATASLASKAELIEGPTPQDAAYILYTSGSTGRPKGVTVSHGALANFLHSMQVTPGLSESDAVAAVTTVSFDIAGLELYLPLLVGARIELVPRATAMDGAALAHLLDSAGITLMQATPATWRLLMDAGWSGRSQLRALCGGEALSRKLADEILDRVSELWNMYGPTETTIWSTVERIQRGSHAISIGRPIANTQVHVLDGSGAVTPIGVAGEICIAGAGVADGYHGLPGLTAERFIADAHSGVAGGRLYRTGDLGRWGADGKLYHLGRSDQQIKLRGFRIELGEIEQALTSHPAVRQAVAARREAGPEDARLVAYVVLNDGEEVTLPEIRRHLRSLLPDYMVPSVIMTLLTLPLSPSGKIDRAALPDPFATPERTEAASDSRPSTMEQQLAQIWMNALKVAHVDRSDNFFELGGYSLLALRVAHQIERRTGRRLDPRALFFRDLHEVAEMLEQDPGMGVDAR